jgi:hypothetical protein
MDIQMKRKKEEEEEEERRKNKRIFCRNHLKI